MKRKCSVMRQKDSVHQRAVWAERNVLCGGFTVYTGGEGLERNRPGQGVGSTWVGLYVARGWGIGTED
jgi:hypothetical protein